MASDEPLLPAPSKGRWHTTAEMPTIRVRGGWGRLLVLAFAEAVRGGLRGGRDVAGHMVSLEATTQHAQWALRRFERRGYDVAQRSGDLTTGQVR